MGLNASVSETAKGSEVVPGSPGGVPRSPITPCPQSSPQKQQLGATGGMENRELELEL